MPPTIQTAHKQVLKEGLGLALELLEHENLQFKYRLTLLIKIVQDLEARTKYLKYSIVWLKLKYLHVRILRQVEDLGQWTPETKSEAQSLHHMTKKDAKIREARKTKNARAHADDTNKIMRHSDPT